MNLNRLLYVVVSVIFLSIISIAHAQDIDIGSLNLQGKIAYIGDDFDIHTIDFATADMVQLTNDGTRRASYEFPTWSMDGQLAYFCCSVRGFENARLSIYLSPDGKSAGKEFYSQDGERHVYAYWSPTTCGTGDCADLAVLVQSFAQSDMRVELFNSQNLESGQRLLGEGSPFYYSWSPTGESLVVHRNNRLLQYYSTTSADLVSAFDESLGNFFSPEWSPVDDRVLFASSGREDMSQLTLIQGDDQRVLVDDLDGFVSFLWSPDGRYIAYRVANTKSISPVYVIDAETAEVVARSNVSGILAFFWSPDSSKIAYITLSNPPGAFDIKNETVGNTMALAQRMNGLAWNVLEINDSSNILLNSFIPTTNMQYLLNYFDQFAQSHSIWSPDSTHIVYSESTGLDSSESLITILDVNDLNGVPLSIVKGTFAVWSYR